MYEDEDEDGDEGLVAACETCGEAATSRECEACEEDSARVRAESNAERRAERRAMLAD